MQDRITERLAHPMKARLLAALVLIPIAFGASQKEAYQAEVARVRLIPWTTAQGKEAQMLLIDWKNTGAEPIGLVRATMRFFGQNGEQLDQVKDYTIFVTYDKKKAIKPGKTYQEPDDKGFILVPMPPGFQKAVRAEAALTKIAGVPEV